MQTLKFQTNNRIFTNQEKDFLQQMITQLDQACGDCELCSNCIFNQFCDNGNGKSPSEVMSEIISTLGVNLN